MIKIECIKGTLKVVAIGTFGECEAEMIASTIDILQTASKKSDIPFPHMCAAYLKTLSDQMADTIADDVVEKNGENAAGGGEGRA